MSVVLAEAVETPAPKPPAARRSRAEEPPRAASHPGGLTAQNRPRTFSLFTLAGLARERARLDRRHALSASDWLLGYGLARPNGSPDTLELTERGAEAAAPVRDLEAWIRS